MDDHDQERPELIQWRGILAACFIFRFDDQRQDQPRNHLLRTLEISSSIPFGGDTFIRSIIGPVFLFLTSE
jgi:hypothetical protein